MIASMLPIFEAHSPRQRRRRGLTLLEVIVAMAIFLMSFIALASLLNMGQMHAIEVQLQATALQKAQSKMSDVICGSEALGSQSSVPFTEDLTQQWTWSMDAEQDPNIANLWVVTITVSHPLDNSAVKVSLTEKLVDPTIKAQWYSNQLGSLSSTSTTSSTTGSTTTGGTTTGGGTTGGAAASGGTTGGGGAAMGGTTTGGGGGAGGAAAGSATKGGGMTP
jgi:prepilin-type N-terminal cleavage/methylation domain-containing protein